jgi:putative membrane protein
MPMSRLFLRKQPSAWKASVSGLVAGLAATAVMTKFQGVWSKASEELKEKPDGKAAESQQSKEEKEDATMKVAGRVASAAGYELSHEKKKKASPAVHYGFGTAMGAVYGLAKETGPRPLRRMRPALCGAGFGTALFLAADEVAVPALGLSKKPSETPPGDHVYGLVSHLVYGLTVAAAFRLTRKLL